MIELKSPQKCETVSLQTAVQKSFTEQEEKRAQLDGSLTFCWYDLEKKGVDNSIPLPVSFTWEDHNEDDTDNDAYYYLLISEKSDISNPWVYTTKNTTYDVYNLKVGSDYFWCVQKNGKQSEIFSFQTLSTLPRCLKIDHISNVRDMGGYEVENGKIRQGLIYRGGEFELHMHLVPTGINDLLRLGLRTEIDMRGEAIGKVDKTTAEIWGIKRVFVPSVPYTKVFDQKQRTALNTFFKVFSNRKNYPIYFHCWGGADRTGTFAFILGAFLGMNYDDLIYEYEFTSLSIWGVRSRNYTEFQDFLQLFMSLPGNTLNEKSTNFLKTYALLTDKQILEIYNILVDKTIKRNPAAECFIS